jgi:hypothetical protein
MIAQITIGRFSYPQWFLEMGGHTSNPDDWSDGRLDEQKLFRESQVSLIGRIFQIKPLIMPCLQLIWSIFESIDPAISKPNEAEVPLQIMVVLAQ